MSGAWAMQEGEGMSVCGFGLANPVASTRGCTGMLEVRSLHTVDGRG